MKNLFAGYKWVIWVAVTLRLVAFIFSTNAGGDAFSRATIVESWLQNPQSGLNHGPVWLPFHFWAMAAVGSLVGDAILAGRLLSLAAGVVSVCLIWSLVRVVFSERAALFSLLVFAFYSLHIAYAGASSSEELYVGFALAGLLGFFQFRSTGSLGWLAFGGIALTLAAGIRYEAWILIGLTGLLLAVFPNSRPYFRGRHLASLATFTLTAGIWPVGTMLVQLQRSDNALAGPLANFSLAAGQLAGHSFVYELFLIPGVVLLTLTPIAVGGAAYTIWATRRSWLARELTMITVAFGLFQLLYVTIGGADALARYSLTIGTLMCAVSGHGLARLVSWMEGRIGRWSYRVLVALLFVNLLSIVLLAKTHHRFTDKVRSVSPFLEFPLRIEGLADFIRPKLVASDALVIDDYNMEASIIAASLGLPLLPVDRLFLANRENPTDLEAFLRSKRPRFVVYSHQGRLAPFLKLRSECPGETRSGGRAFRCVYGNDIYSVYAVTYPE